jgi:glycosyltransferase 2 family protein
MAAAELGRAARSWWLRAAVSLAAIAVLLSLVPLDAVMASLKRVSLSTWSLCVLIFCAGHYLNALKLRLLLDDGDGSNPALSAACVRAQYAGLVGNLGLPGLAGGDLVRGAYLAPLVGVRRVAVASIADRLIDTATVVALIVIGLPLAGVPATLEASLRAAAMWIVLAGIVAGILALTIMRLRFSKVFDKVRGSVAELAARRRALATAAVISMAVQSTFVLINVWLAREVGVTTSTASWFVAWPMSKLIAILPISLGGIGVREGALVAFMAPYGGERDAVLASGVLWQGVLIATALAGFAITQLLPRTPAEQAASAAKGT